MIKVIVKKELKHLRKVEVSGHANYEEYGKDIVCAATSAIITTTVNGILAVQNRSLKVLDDGKLLVIDVLTADEVVEKLLFNMITLLEELENQYPKNIKVITKGE